jgi:hypothetical protein
VRAAHKDRCIHVAGRPRSHQVLYWYNLVAARQQQPRLLVGFFIVMYNGLWSSVLSW